MCACRGAFSPCFSRVCISDAAFFSANAAYCSAAAEVLPGQFLNMGVPMPWTFGARFFPRRPRSPLMRGRVTHGDHSGTFRVSFPACCEGAQVWQAMESQASSTNLPDAPFRSPIKELTRYYVTTTALLSTSTGEFDLS